MWSDGLPPHLRKHSPTPAIPVQLAGGHAGKKPTAPKGAKMPQPAGKGDCSAFIQLCPSEFARFCDTLLRMGAAHTLSGVATTFDAIRAALGHAPLYTSNWARTIVTCEGDGDLDVAVIIAKAGAFGHRQLIQAIDGFCVKIGVVIAHGLARFHSIAGDRERQCAQLAAFCYAAKRASGFKSKRPVHTALMCSLRVARICSFHARTLKDMWDKEGGCDAHSTMACPSCDDVVLVSSIRRRKNPVVPLCSQCQQVPGFKGTSYARPRHSLPSRPPAGGSAPREFLLLT